MSLQKPILTFGWSPYHRSSRGGVKRYHYYPGGKGTSLCGHAELDFNKRKIKFINLEENHNPNKFCKHCLGCGAPK